jgi:hypothetical protein
MVPLLGHMFEAKRTPCLVSPGVTPSSAAAETTEFARGPPTRIAATSARVTCVFLQPLRMLLMGEAISVGEKPMLSRQVLCILQDRFGTTRLAGVSLHGLCEKNRLTVPAIAERPSASRNR